MTTLRTDLIDVYIFRRGNGPEFLQLERARDPLARTWQPVMGHSLQGETALACAVREMYEETGLTTQGVVNFWSLTQVSPYYLASMDAVVMSPRFAAEVPPDWEPTLNPEHTAHRWVPAESIDIATLWPDQRDAYREIMSEVLAGTAASSYQRIDLTPVDDAPRP